MKILKDSDIFLKPKFDEPEQYEDRKTVKLIILNRKEEIALITNPVHGFYLLPGGGADTDDLEQEAVREAVEETKLVVEIERRLETIEEFRNRNAKHYFTTCFVAKVIGETDEDLRTEEEIKNGLNMKFFSLEEAKEIMKNQTEKVKEGKVEFYNTAFNIIRDYYFIDRTPDLILETK